MSSNGAAASCSSTSEDAIDIRRMNDTTMPPPPPRPNKTKALVGQPPTSTTTNKHQKPVPRRKEGLRKGFGLHDWSLLTKRAKDLAQRKGAPLRQITPQEMAQHNQVYDGWCALKGKVYNVGPYLPYHPGGERIMHSVLGKDATALFDKYHRWVNIDGLIGTLQIGYLDLGSSTDDEDTRKLKTPVYLKSSSSQQQQQQQQQQTTAKDEFSVPAPVITKVKARNVSNVLPKPVDKTEEVEEDYKEPWEE